MAEKPYAPLLIGTSHAREDLQATFWAIDDLAAQGGKTLAIEQSVPLRHTANAIREVLKDSSLSPHLRAFFTAQLKHAESMPDNEGYFDIVARYARERGLQVLPIPFDVGLARIERLGTRQWLQSVLKGAPVKDIEAKLQYPAGYVTLNLQTKRMLSFIRKTRPQAVLAGMGHVLLLARTFRVPTEKWIVIGQRMVFAPPLTFLISKSLAMAQKKRVKEASLLERQRVKEKRRRARLLHLK
ncbi:MAG: hypothetical protein HY393_01150 [Candidatus Diapherotrites archaeon]|nr:hypothetical protein [Candidatus Diapherotrites archaeon]